MLESFKNTNSNSYNIFKLLKANSVIKFILLKIIFNIGGLPFPIQFIVIKFKELIGRSKCVLLLLQLDKTSVFPIRTSEHDSLSTMQNRPRLIIFKSESLSLSVPICFYVFSVGWSQTALLFPAFYDYRAKLTSLGSGEERRDKDCHSYLGRHQSS